MVRRILLLADLVSLTLALTVATLLLAPSGVEAGAAHTIAMALLIGVIVAFAGFAGLYSRDEIRPDNATADDLPGIFHCVTAGAFVACIAVWASGNASELPLVFAGWACMLVAMPLGRALARTLARRHGAYAQRTLVLGAGDIGQLVARKLRQHPEYGLELVGFLDDDPLPLAADVRDTPVLGGCRDLAAVVRAQRVERVIVAFSGLSSPQELSLVRTLRKLDLQVDVVPRLFEAVGPSVSITTIEGLAIVALPPTRGSRSHLAVKRAMDIVGAGVGLVVLAPLMAAIALAIRVECRGPLLYRGPRVGRGGRLFEQLKFRTMRPEFCAGPGFGGESAEEAFARMLDENPALADEFHETQKLADDPRVSRVGRVLRRTSLDELPQLWNVLRGELSLVGPRPVTEQEVRDRYRPRIEDPLSGEPLVMGYWDTPDLRPGLTGYWQISGRSSMSFNERIRLDTAYLMSWSLRLDLEILAKTFRAVLASRGAY